MASDHECMQGIQRDLAGRGLIGSVGSIAAFNAMLWPLRKKVRVGPRIAVSVCLGLVGGYIGAATGFEAAAHKVLDLPDESELKASLVHLINTFNPGLAEARRLRLEGLDK
mmetsp:Transcript_9689/g.18465  ORF Transcript_9689/g.18465 Transcript_9689/m.18465 type:complete len:111 (+) Transcript_9689:58-390(+)